MAHKKTSGSTRGNRDSFSKRLGVKIPDGKQTLPGNIIVRQRGTKFRAGKNVKRGNDDSLYSVKKGTVQFTKKYKRSHYNNKRKIVGYVNVVQGKTSKKKAK